eukprot:COSAG02_NODE_41685_length_392_cov_0.556314_1_plen_63_part_10
MTGGEVRTCLRMHSKHLVKFEHLLLHSWLPNHFHGCLVASLATVGSSSGAEPVGASWESMEEH